MPSWRLRNLLNARLLAGLLCLTGMGMVAGAGPTGSTLPSGSQPADKTYEIVRMSKPDGTVVEMRVPRHGSLLAKRPAAPRGTVRQLPGTAAAGEEPAETPRIGGRRAVRLQQAPTARASSEGPVRPARADAGRRDSGRVVTQRANSGARISHPYTGTRQLSSDVVDLMRPAGTPRRGAVSQTPVVASDNASEWRTGLGWVPNNEDDDTGRYLSEDDAFAELVPGDGWDGPTDEPGPIGNDSMPGWDAKAIARWDVVPYQTFDEPFHIGVVAFHMNGIDRVDFSVNGGPWVSVEEMQLNPRTDVWEYTAVLRPEFFAEDGLVEVRAIVWPEGAGVPRVLAGDIDEDSLRSGDHCLLLSADYRGTLASPTRYVAMDGDDSLGNGSEGAPFRTMYRALTSIADEAGSVDGGTVYLKAGEYEYGGATSPYVANSTRWLTVTRAPGLDRGDVRLVDSTGSQGLRLNLVRIDGVEIRPKSPTTRVVTTIDTGEIVDFLWMSDCLAVGHDRDGNWSDRATNWSGAFLTGTWIEGFHSGITYREFARNCHVEAIRSDAFTATPVVINCTVNDIDRGDTDEHADVYQFHNYGDPLENIIVFGLQAFDVGAQGIFAKDGPIAEDVALVNILIDRMDNDPVSYLSQWDMPADHVLLWYVTVSNQTFLWRRPTSQIHNMSIKGCSFHKLQLNDGASLDASWFANNHFVDTNSWRAQSLGENFTTGDPMFEDLSSNDYRPAPGSPLSKRIHDNLLRVDAAGGLRQSPTAVGALGAAAETLE